MCSASSSGRYLAVVAEPKKKPAANTFSRVSQSEAGAGLFRIIAIVERRQAQLPAVNAAVIVDVVEVGGRSEHDLDAVLAVRSVKHGARANLDLAVTDSWRLRRGKRDQAANHQQ